MKAGSLWHVAVLSWVLALVACGGGDTGETLDLGGGLSMTASGAIVDNARAREGMPP
jgi:hypothetical protein